MVHLELFFFWGGGKLLLSWNLMEILTADHFENMWKEAGSNQEFFVKFCQTNWIFLCQNDRTDTSVEVTAVIYLDFKWASAATYLAYKLQNFFK